MSADLVRLVRVRWAVRAVLAASIAASVLANLANAQPSTPARLIAAWPPVALALTIELLSRVPVDRAALAAVRVAATSVIGSIAAWVSYGHMAAVAARYGEPSASAHLIPLSVDGLVVVASVCLIELAPQIRAAEQRPVDLDPDHVRPTTAAPAGLTAGEPEGSAPQHPPARHPTAGPLEEPATPAASNGPVPAGPNGQRRRTAEQLRAELDAAISVGRLDGQPTAEAIRVALGCSPTRARALRDQRHGNGGEPR